MGIGGHPKDVDVDSVTTDSLTDGADGQAWETLREIGYEKGDVVPITSFTTTDSRNSSTTSTTFASSNGSGESVIRFDSLGPVSQLRFGLSVRFQPGSGETMTGRFLNFDDSEEIVSVTGSSGSTSQEWSGWTTYTPTTSSSPVLVFYEHKVDTGTNSSTSRSPALWVGIEI